MADPDDFRPYDDYRLGEPVPPDLEERRCREMIRIVAYDIADPKRLRQVARTCLDYGARVEKSVFECDLSNEDFERLWLELIDLIDEDEDALIAYTVCASCARGIESAGAIVRPEKRIAYIV